MRKLKICPICGRTFEQRHGCQKYCSDGCREIMKKAYEKRWREKHANGIEMKTGVIRISKDIVKAPPECVGQTTCLECTRKRCKHG